MKLRHVACLAAIVAISLTDTSSTTSLQAQSVLEPGGQAELGLMLRRLNTVGIFMMATAHPDDEDNGPAGEVE